MQSVRLNMRITNNKILVAFVLLLVSIIALPNLFESFSGDQALFTVYAEQISNGAVLYRDVWDVKQPGIFVFYLIAGTLFGFNEIGIHFFELLYFLLFSFLLIITLKDYFHNKKFSLLTPLLTVGTYYAVSDHWHLTQVEGIVGFPIYLSMWTAIKYVHTNERKWLFLSGLCGGIVIVFKQLFLLILVSFWMTVLISTFIKSRKISAIFQTVLPLIPGIAIPVLAVIAYFAWHNELEHFAYTTFVYPNQAIAALTSEKRTYVLISGIRWFLIKFIPLIFFTFLGMIVFLGNTSETSQSFFKRVFTNLKLLNLLTINLGLWLLVGFAVILIQRLSWWEYHYVLFFIPLGILATKSLEIVWERFFEGKTYFANLNGKFVFVLLIFALLSPTIYRTARKTKNKLNSIVVFVKEGRFTPSGLSAEDYELVNKEIAFLQEPNSRPGKIFVMVQPLFYHLSKRPPALATNGWMPEFFLKAQWQRLNEELVEKKPVFVFINKFGFDLIMRNSPETMQIIDKHYRLRSKTSYISCYELNH